MMKEASEYNKNKQDNYNSFIKEAGLILGSIIFDSIMHCYWLIHSLI